MQYGLSHNHNNINNSNLNNSGIYYRLQNIEQYAQNFINKYSQRAHEARLEKNASSITKTFKHVCAPPNVKQYIFNKTTNYHKSASKVSNNQLFEKYDCKELVDVSCTDAGLPKYSQLQASVQSMQNNISQLQMQLHQSQQQQCQLQSQTKSYQLQMDAMFDQLEKSESKVSTLKTQLKEAINNNDSLQRQCDIFKQDCEKLLESKSKLYSGYNKLNETLQQSLKENIAIKNEISNNKSVINKLNKTIIDLNIKFAKEEQMAQQTRK